MKLAGFFISLLYLQLVVGKAFFGSLHFHKYFPRFGGENEEYEQCYLQDVCRKTLPQETESRMCEVQRDQDILIARQFYKLTEIDSPFRATNFPVEEIPFLNQTSRNVAFYFSLDKFESRFIAAFSAISRAFAGNIVGLIKSTFAQADLKNPVTHIQITRFVEQIVRSFGRPQIFSSPSLETTFTDIISTNNLYQTDETFVQIFLAKTCPFTIRRVTPENAMNGYSIAKLKRNLNQTFDIDNAIEQALGRKMTLDKAVVKHLLYISHNEEMNGIPPQPDFYVNQTGNSTMDNPTSPIAIFINKDGLLKVVAIQLDYTPDSEVVTPDSSFKWTKAKATTIAMSKQFCDAYMHGGHMHSVGALFCTVYRRHFSTLHPLYDVLKHHCEGTSPSFALTFSQILLPGGFLEKTHTIGNKGVDVLTKRAFLDRKFRQMNLPVLLRRLGMSYFSDKNIPEIKYYPFRDDAREIWRELYRFVNKVVFTFYGCDEDVIGDKELQNFASEMTFGGIGNFTGFPRAIRSRHILRKTLLTLLWYPVMHGIINYGLLPSFPLGFPVKLYTNQVKEDTVLNLGNIDNIAELVTIENFLGSVRINRIMNYYEDVTDPRLRNIVYESYKNFHGRIQKRLEKRNANRKKRNQLGIQFLEPKWLPNSIHI